MLSNQGFYPIKSGKNVPATGNVFAGPVNGSIYPSNEETNEVISIRNSLMPGWRTATLHVIDKSNNRSLLISETYWVHEDNMRTKTIKKRLYEMYTAYKLTQASAGDNM